MSRRRAEPAPYVVAVQHDGSRLQVERWVYLLWLTDPLSAAATWEIMRPLANAVEIHS